MIYPLTHENGKKDSRYTITQEYTGDPSGKPRSVLRFCDDYIGDFRDIPSATLRAVGHNNERMGAYVFVNQPVGG